MRRGIKKRILAGFLAMTMLFGNGLQAWASNGAQPLVQMSETETDLATVTENVAEQEDVSTIETIEEETTPEDTLMDTEEETDNIVSEEDADVPSEGDNNPDGVTDSSETAKEDNNDVDGTLPEETIPEDSEIAEETDVVEEDAEEEEETELLDKDMLSVQDRVVFSDNGDEVNISNLPKPTDLSTTEDETHFGNVTVSWKYPTGYDVKGFRIYRSDDNGITYNDSYESYYWVDETDENGNAIRYASSVDVPLDQNSGNNGIATFKVVPVDSFGAEGEFATVQNKGGGIGSDFPESEYNGLRFLDDKGNPIDSLTLHVGESKKIGLAFTKEDGGIANMLTDSVLKEYHTAPDSLDKDYNFEINWQVVSVNGQPTELKMNWVDYATSDVDWLLTKEFVENKEAYFIARSMPADGTRYFIEARVTGPFDSGEIFWLRLPINIEAAEEGVTYVQPEELEIATTQQEANQKMRDLMTSRDYEGWFVAEGISEFEPDSLMDTNAERNGMKPNEGDYLKYTVGDRDAFSTHITYYERGYNDYKNKSYTLYRSTVPFITTAEEEKQVDNKIQALVHTPGGALYNAAHGENVSTEDKVRAIYNWITKNVSGTVPGDRRTPIYHTVYHTLIKGSGTCGAFALLFTRLSREMGIPSKVIMGTDSAAHAYNIVQVGNKWYFIDTSSSRWLADAKSFTRANEQEHYRNKNFIKNYLSKIPGSDYIVESEGIVAVNDSIGSEEQIFNDMGLAVAYVVEQAALSDEEVTYTMTVRDGNMAFPEDGMLFTDASGNEYGHRVALDLGGFTLILPDSDGSSSPLAAKSVSNGYISVGDSACLELYATNHHEEATYQDLDIVYKSTSGGIGNTPKFKMWTEGNGRIVLEDTVKIEKFYDIYLEGNAEVNCDMVADGVALGAYSLPDITVNGTITAEQMLLLYGGTADVETLISKDTTQIYEPHNVKLIIGEELKLNGYTALSYSMDEYIGPLEVTLERHFASAEDNTPTKAATVNWTGQIFNYHHDYTMDEARMDPIFHFMTKDYVNGELQENKAFASGDTIGKVTAKGLEDVNASTYNYNVVVTPANYADYFTVKMADPEKNFVDIENNMVSVTSLSMVVTETSTGKSASFSSLKKAIDGLGNVAGKKAGEYIFSFTENVSLSANLSLPDYVQKAVFKVADTVEDDVTIDFKGYSLTTKGTIAIEEGIKLISSAMNSGKLISSKSTDASSYSMKLMEDVDKVNLSATSGTLVLEGTEGETRKILGDISAKEVQVNGTWEVEGTISNSGLHNYGTLICDTITQSTSNKTYLEDNSLLVVNKNAKLYNVTCEDSAMETQPSIYRAKKAEVSLNGTFTSQNQKLRFAVLDENDAQVDGLYDTFVDFAAREALFTTTVKTFPVESVQLVQNSQIPKYTSLMQVNDKVLVVGEWIILKAQGVDGKEEIIKKFTNWKEASTYINNLSNASMTYVVEITDHLDLEEALTMPTKAAGIVFRGVSEGDELVKLKYTGDLKLSTNTTFENIDLGAEKLNTSTKQYEPYLSAANLADKSLTLLNSDAEFVSVTGTNTSILRVEGDGNLVTVSKAVKTLNALEVIGATVEIGSALKLTEAAISGVKDMMLDDATVLVNSGTVAMTGTLFMESATLDANSKIEVVDVISNSDSNCILYGGNEKTNILTVKGNVIAGSDVIEDNALPFRKAAIDITVKSLAEKNAYVQDATLLNAQKALAAWFVVGGIYAEDGNRTGATYLTHKKGTIIMCGKAAASVAELYVYDEAARSYTVCDSYATLQEAFDEIDRIGNTNQSYRIVLTGDTVLDKDYKFPTKAASVLILSKEGSQYTIGFKSKTDLKCDTDFQNVALQVSGKTGTLAINANQINLTNVKIAENIAITGNGVAKGSRLHIAGNDWIRAASIKDVDTLVVTGTQVYINEATTVGTISLLEEGLLCGKKAIKIGNVECSGTGTIISFPTVSATEVKPALEITGELRVADVYENGNTTRGKLCIGLGKELNFITNQDGTTNVGLVCYDSTDFSDTIVNNNKAVLAKAPKVSPKDMEWVQQTTLVSGHLYKKSGNIVYKKNDPTVVLSYNNEAYDGVINTTKVFETECETFADAVAEIDNLKIKRDYTVCFLPTTGNMAAELKMPKSNNVKTLTLTSRVTGSNVISDVFYLKAISFTSDVSLKDISFVQMVQAKDAGGEVIAGQYVPITSDNKYPAAVSVKTSGNELVMSGNVSFNTPIALDGGNKAVLNVAEDAKVRALATSKPGTDTNIQGTISKFKEVNINNAFCLEGPQTSNNTYGTCTMDVTTLKVGHAGEVVVGSHGENDTFKAKDVILESGEVIVNGNAQLTNVTLAGNSPLMEVSGQTFTITGVITSTANNGTLVTTVDKDGKSVLNISGTAVLRDNKENRIVVSVVDEEGTSVKLNGAPLLKASKIKANIFKVHEKSTPGGNTEEYSLKEAVPGYFLKKNKEYVEVYSSDNIVAALCKTEEIPQSADEEIPVINYFATLEEAIAEIKSLNQVSQEYTIMLLKDVGNSETFVKMTVPEKAAKVTFTKPSKLAGSIKLYVEASLTQKTNLGFENITVVNKKNWDTKNFDLILKNADITVKDKATATKLTLVNGAVLRVEKAATITDILNQNAVGNRNNEIICMLPAGLTIKGYVTDIDSNGQSADNIKNFPRLILDANGQATLLEESYAPIKQKDVVIGEQYNLSKTKKLATLEKETMDSFVFQNGGDEVNAVWAAKGIYQVEDDYEYAVDVVTLDVLDKENGTYKDTATTQCLDVSEAANYINTVSKKANGYYVKLEEQTDDTKVTDTKAVSEFVMPAKDKAEIVIFKPKNNGGDKATVSFTGDVKANGNVTFEKVDFNNSNVFSMSTIKGTYTLELNDVQTDKLKSITDVTNLRLVNSNITTQYTAKVENLKVEKNAVWNCYGATTIGNVALKLDGTGGNTYLGTYHSKDNKGNSTGIPQLTVTGKVTGGKLPVKVHNLVTEGKITNYVELDNYSDAKLVLAKAEAADKFVGLDYAQFNGSTFEYEYKNKDITPYKDKSGYVSNGTISDKQVLLEQQDKNGNWRQSYVKNYAEAIDIINNGGTKTDIYKITLRGNEESVNVGTLVLPKKDKAKQLVIVGNGKNDVGENVSQRTLIFKGAIQPKCDLVLDNIVLQEVDSSGKTVDGITVKTDAYKVTFGENVEVNISDKFETDAALVFKAIDGNKGGVTFEGNSVHVIGELKVKELAVSGDTDILSEGKVTVTDIAYKNADSEEWLFLALTGKKEIVITNILSENVDNTLDIITYYKNKAFAESETQLTINGEVDDEVAVNVWPMIYDKVEETYHELAQPEAMLLQLTADATPKKFQKVINAPKMMVSDEVKVWYFIGEDEWSAGGEADVDEDDLQAIKHEGGIYFSNEECGIEVVGYQVIEKDVDGKPLQIPEEIQMYQAEFFTWDQAVKEIDKLNHMDWKYVINVLKDQGCITPLKSVAMPAKAKEVVIEGANHAGILTTGNKITLKCETEFKDISLCAVKKGDSYYSIPLTLDSGQFNMSLNGVNSQCEYDDMGWFASDIILNGAAKSTIEVDIKDGNYYDMISKITNAGRVILHAGKDNETTSSCYYVIKDGIKGVKQLELLAGAMVNTENSEVSVTDLTIGQAMKEVEGNGYQKQNNLHSSLNAKNITVSGTTYMASCDLTAGTTAVGDGKITLTNVVFRDNYNLMEGKLDKNGKTSINIKGTVSYDTTYPVSQNATAVTVGLYLNNSTSAYVMLTEGMSLLTAPKAATSMFNPNYALVDDNDTEDTSDDVVLYPNMGSFIPGWGLYKSGNDIKYGNLTKNEVRVHIGSDNAEGIGNVPCMEFATYEEAIKAIDSMAISKQDGSKQFEDYTLELLSDVMVGNDKGDGKYATLTLPSKSYQFTILGNGHSIEFSGNVSLKCNTTLQDVQMLAMKAVKGVATPTTMNITVGNFILTNDHATLGYYEGDTFVTGVNNVTGSAKGYLVMDQDSYLEANSVSGMNLQFVGNGEELLYKQQGDENSGVKAATICTKGNLTVKQLIFKDCAGGHIEVNGNLVLDAINTYGSVYAEFIICDTKPMQIKGMTQTIDDVKVTDSIFFLEEKGEVTKELVLNVKSTTKQEVASGTKVITGKYLDGNDWKVRTVLGEEASDVKTLYLNGVNLHLGSEK